MICDTAEFSDRTGLKQNDHEQHIHPMQLRLIKPQMPLKSDRMEFLRITGFEPPTACSQSRNADFV